MSNIEKYNPFNPELFIPNENKHIHYEPNIYNNISNNIRIENPQVNEIQGVNNNVGPNEINNNNNNNINNINNDNNNINNDNILNINNQRQNNQVNLRVIRVENGEDSNSTEAWSSKSEINY